MGPQNPILILTASILGFRDVGILCIAIPSRSLNPQTLRGVFGFRALDSWLRVFQGVGALVPGFVAPSSLWRTPLALNPTKLNSGAGTHSLLDAIPWSVVHLGIYTRRLMVLLKKSSLCRCELFCTGTRNHFLGGLPGSGLFHWDHCKEVDLQIVATSCLYGQSFPDMVGHSAWAHLRGCWKRQRKPACTLADPQLPLCLSA